MNKHANILETHFQELLQPSRVHSDNAADVSGELGHLQVGMDYRVLPTGRYPVLQFLLLFPNGNAIEVKYSHITERFFYPVGNRFDGNELVVRVRDMQQIMIHGYNLGRLNEDLLVQRVVEIGSVTLIQAQAMLKQKPATPVVTGIRLEYGMMDMQNGVWTKGEGRWSDQQQCWIPDPQ